MSSLNVPPAPAVIFQIGRLTKTNGGPRTSLANDDISFSIAEGFIRGILGPAGAGKTTPMARKDVCHRTGPGGVV